MSGPSVLDYARFHGLANNAHLRNLFCHLEGLHSLPVDDGGRITAFDPLQSQIELPDDKLQVSADAGNLLAKCMTAPEMSPDSLPPSDHRRLKSLLTLEMPMLRADHSKDMKWFRKRQDVYKLLTACAEKHSLEYADTDDPPDSLEQCTIAASETESTISSERLQTTKEVIISLSKYFADPWTSKDLAEVLRRELKRPVINQNSPPTPLLTPSLQFCEPDAQLPSIPNLNLTPRWQTQPDNSILEDDEGRQLQDESPIRTSDADEAGPDHVRHFMATATSAPTCDTNDQWHIPIEPATYYDLGRPAVKSEDVKLEIPLLPSTKSSVENNPKCVNLEDLLVQYIDDPIRQDLNQSNAYQEQPSDRDLARAFEDSQLGAIDQIVKESLGINDKLLRVDVKAMQGIAIESPRSHQTLGEFTAAYFDQVCVSKLAEQPQEEKSLHWIPIPRKSMQVDLHEELDSGDYLTQITKRPNNIIRSQQLLWKEPGHRVLDVPEDEIEEVEEDTDLSSVFHAAIASEVPQKRPLAFDLPEDTSSKQRKHCLAPMNGDLTPILTPHSSQSAPSLIQTQFKFTWPTADPRSQRRPYEPLLKPARGTTIPVLAPPKGLNAGSDSISKRLARQPPQPFSAASSLSSFLELRGDKFKKAVPAEVPLGAGEVANDPIQASQPMALSACTDHDRNIEVPSTPRYSPSHPERPYPQLEPLIGSRTIIAEESLLENRTVIKMLDQHADSGLTTIYRDLMGQPSLILNPTTCILLTNAQALAQRSLPGQSANSSGATVQARIKALVSEYELVFILVTLPESRTGPTWQIQLSQMAGFASFCASFEGTNGGGRACPVWIPVENGLSTHSRPDPVCTWIWHLVCRHGFHNNVRTHGGHSSRQAFSDELVLIQETTVWELFLRRCGMNPLAAQVILGALKKHGNAEQGVDCSGAGLGFPQHDKGLGLRQLVSMSHEQRCELFEDLVGSACLMRISQALDVQWRDAM